MKNKLYYDTYKDNSLDTLEHFFVLACESGDLELVRYFLLNTELLYKIDISCRSDQGLRWACRDGQLDIVKYLLSSPELSKHSNIHSDCDGALFLACMNSHIDVARYLLFSSDLKDHAKIYFNNNLIITHAFESDNIPLVEFLIFEYNVEENDIIKDIILFNEPVKDMFRKRELLKKLCFELVPKHATEENVKI